jgi:hypothetical protein
MHSLDHVFEEPEWEIQVEQSQAEMHPTTILDLYFELPFYDKFDCSLSL